MGRKLGTRRTLTHIILCEFLFRRKGQMVQFETPEKRRGRGEEKEETFIHAFKQEDARDE